MKRFKKIYIEITNVCNLTCSFCPSSKRKPEFMEITCFDEIINQVKNYTDYICLHVKGEPLLHPKLSEILDICANHNIKVNITTNGTLINKVWVQLLQKPALRQINFSLHSFGGEDVKNQEQYIENILKISKEILQKENILISYRFWNLSRDNNVNSSNANFFQAIEKAYSLDFSLEEEALKVRGIKIADSIYVNQDYEFEWPSLDAPEDDGVGFCYGLRNQLAILVDGTVVPCCLDGEGIINLGNIKANNLSEILRSERVDNIYNGFSNRQAVEELCRKCGYRKKFT